MIIIKGLSLPKDHMELVIYSNGEVADLIGKRARFKRSTLDTKGMEIWKDWQRTLTA